MKTIKGYKAFNKGLVCRDFQFEVGKEYTHQGEIKICNSGFHFCENPLDVLNYYNLTTCEFAEVEATGKIDKDKNSKDSKLSTDKIKIGVKLDLSAFVKASVNFIWEKASKKSISKKNSATSGNDAHSATSGEYAHSATSGNRANSATSGYGAHSATSTQDAIACAVGRKAKAKASLGSWIVIAEWKESSNLEDVKPLCVLSTKVDGKKIKADQWYKVVNKKFVETDDSNE